MYTAFLSAAQLNTPMRGTPATRALRCVRSLLLVALTDAAAGGADAATSDTTAAAAPDTTSAPIVEAAPMQGELDAGDVTPIDDASAASSVEPVELNSDAPASLSAEFWDALAGGKIDFYARYRFEQVEDDQLPVLRNAHANTLRTTLGYSTQLFHDFGAYVQLEDVRVIGDARYNDGGSNGIVNRAVVVDPEGTEVQQALLRYRGIPRTQLMIGRQDIEHRAAPLNRYVGAVPWRQNWQSFDGIRVTSDYLPAFKADYSHIWNVNRIFGEANPIADRSDYDVGGHLLSVTYSGVPYSTLEGYAYLLNFDSNAAATKALSTSTYGARLQGAWDVVQYAAKLLYTAEYAQQRDYADNPIEVSVDYTLLELGLNKAFPYAEFESVMAKVSYEVLEGEGRKAVGAGFVPGSFQTPLGTNHAFQGWADRFLTTPADGVEDWYGTVTVRAFATNLMLVYHTYSSSNDDYDYGHEWNLQLTRAFADHYTVGLKYADYSAADDTLNRARNGAASAGKQAFDLKKVWAWVELRF